MSRDFWEVEKWHKTDLYTCLSKINEPTVIDWYNTLVSMIYLKNFRDLKYTYKNKQEK